MDPENPENPEMTVGDLRNLRNPENDLLNCTKTLKMQLIFRGKIYTHIHGDYFMNNLITNNSLL